MYFRKIILTASFVQKEKSYISIKQQISKTNKKKFGDPLRGLIAMPFQTKARKCNHRATEELRELKRKFKGTVEPRYNEGPGD